MAVQSSANRNIVPFITGAVLSREAETIARIIGRAVPLAPYTLMGKIAATGLWKPCDDAADSDGSAIPQGIYMGDAIPAAALAAANVVNCQIVVGGAGAVFDAAQLVIEEGMSPPMDLDTIISVDSIDLRTVRERLYGIGLFAESNVAIDGYEN